MDSKLLTILNHQLSTKLDLLPILATSNPFSLNCPKTLSNLYKNKTMDLPPLYLTQMTIHTTMMMKLIPYRHDIYLGPTPPTPQMINLTRHQQRSIPHQKEMTLYLQECFEPPSSVDLVHTVMLTIDATTVISSTHSFVDD
jgi:hypothetical protein